MLGSMCTFPISEDCLCGAPAPRRETYCHFHAGIAAIQRRAVCSEPPEAEGARTDLIFINGKNKVEACSTSIGDLEAVAAPIECRSVTLADLNPGMCKFVLGDDCYCGLPAVKAWCEHHARIVYEPAPERARRDGRLMRAALARIC
jgi:hypothetical protein